MWHVAGGTAGLLHPRAKGCPSETSGGEGNSAGARMRMTAEKKKNTALGDPELGRKELGIVHGALPLGNNEGTQQTQWQLPCAPAEAQYQELGIYCHRFTDLAQPPISPNITLF